MSMLNTLTKAVSGSLPFLEEDLMIDIETFRVYRRN